MKDVAIAIVNEMVNNGYTLFNETAEQFAARMNYDITILNMFKKRFMTYKQGR